MTSSDEFNITEAVQKEIARIGIDASRGSDGIGGYEFNNRKDEIESYLISKLSSGKYITTRYLEILQLKSKDKPPRVISKCTLRDKAALRVMNSYLRGNLPANSLLKLPNQVVRDFVAVYVNVFNSERHLVRLDIKSFYDTIRHDLVLGKIKGCLDENWVEMINTAIKTTTGIRIQADNSSAVGIPQGLPISNSLADLALIDFDKQFSDYQWPYFRYVDDIVKVCKDAETAMAMLNEMKTSLGHIGLSENMGKTKTISVREEFTYLGYRFFNGSVGIPKSSKTKYISSIYSIFSKYKKWERTSIWNGIFISDRSHIHKVLINNINEKLVGAKNGNERYGWVPYYQEINDLSSLRAVDGIVREKICGIDGGLLQSLKSCVRSYYSVKYNKYPNYIYDYAEIDNPVKRMIYLVDYGHAHPSQANPLSVDQINRMYFAARSGHLSALDKDSGFAS